MKKTSSSLRIELETNKGSEDCDEVTQKDVNTDVNKASCSTNT